jgi:hypothetical protein
VAWSRSRTDHCAIPAHIPAKRSSVTTRSTWTPQSNWPYCSTSAVGVAGQRLAPHATRAPYCAAATPPASSGTRRSQRMQVPTSARKYPRKVTRPFTAAAGWPWATSR